PANAFGRSAELLQRAVLNLANPLLADAQQMTDLPQAVCAVAGQSETEIEDATFARPEVFHKEIQGFLPFGVLSQSRALVIGHGLGELEVAVIIQDCVERDGSAGCGLKMRQVLQAAPRAGSKLLRAGQMLAPM